MAVALELAAAQARARARAQAQAQAQAQTLAVAIEAAQAEEAVPLAVLRAAGARWTLTLHAALLDPLVGWAHRVGWTSGAELRAPERERERESRETLLE